MDMEDGKVEYTLWLWDHDRNGICYATVDNVEHGQYLWTQIAGIKGVNLMSFSIHYGKMPVYVGNYVTDEC
jgi:hypothetical protein